MSRPPCRVVVHFANRRSRSGVRDTPEPPPTAEIAAFSWSRYDNIVMLRAILSLLLSASVISCPLLCRAGSACCRGEQSQRTYTCCDSRCQQNAHPASHKSGPANHRPHSPASCNCICRGAVVEISASQHLEFVGHAWAAIPSVDPLLVVIAHIGPQAASWETLPDDVNLGRAMRCRMMSYLC